MSDERKGKSAFAEDLAVMEATAFAAAANNAAVLKKIMGGNSEAKRPDRVLVVARDAENPPGVVDMAKINAFLADSLIDIEGKQCVAAKCSTPVDLYQLIDGRWSFVGAPREAKPFRLDDRTMLVPIHEVEADYEHTGWEILRLTDAGWQRDGQTEEPEEPVKIPFMERHSVEPMPFLEKMREEANVSSPSRGEAYHAAFDDPEYKSLHAVFKRMDPLTANPSDFSKAASAALNALDAAYSRLVAKSPSDDSLDQWVYKLRPAGNEKGVLLSGGPFNGMKLAVAPDQGSAEFASGDYRMKLPGSPSIYELWEFEPTAAKPVSMGDAVVMHMQHLEKAKPPLPLICVFAGSPSPPMVAIRNVDGTPSVLGDTVRYGGRISLNKEVVFDVEPRWVDSAKGVMSIPMSDRMIRQMQVGTVYHLELWADGADGARTFLFIGGLERRPDRKAEAVSLASDPFAKDWAAPVVRETPEPGVHVREYPVERIEKAYGVPIGYDIEVEESPQPTAEQEAEAKRVAEGLKGKQETWRDRPSLI